jgi:hypothetical protein
MFSIECLENVHNQNRVYPTCYLVRVSKTLCPSDSVEDSDQGMALPMVLVQQVNYRTSQTQNKSHVTKQKSSIRFDLMVRGLGNMHEVMGSILSSIVNRKRKQKTKNFHCKKLGVSSFH